MRIGIFPNLVKRESAAIVKELIRICEARGLEYYLPAYVSESCQPAYQEIAADHFRPRMTIYDTIDIAMVLGGDGTILKMANKFASQTFPSAASTSVPWGSSMKSKRGTSNSAWTTSWPENISSKNG